MTGPVVDTPSAEEFQREILAACDPEELAGLGPDLQAKASLFAALLADPDRVPGPEELTRVLRRVFSTRRRVATLLEGVGPQRLGAGVHALLHGPDPLPERVETFDALLAGWPDPAFDLPGELLHFTFPDRYWLWSRWMWDPRTETGALPLVTMEEFDLGAPGRGAGYLRVGQAVAFVHETGRAAGFTGPDTGLFGTDVFLAAVYGVYMYTVLRMRMTQEFNRIVPRLPELTRRLLGIHHREED